MLVHNITELYHPGEDVSEAPAEVQAIAAALWTDGNCCLSASVPAE